MNEVSTPHIAFFVTVILLTVAIYFVPITQIVHKAGYSRWWILIWLVPIANIVFLWLFAFSRWPIEDRK